MYWPFTIFLGHPSRAIQSPQPIGAPSWPCFNVSGVTAELSQSSALSMEEAVCYTDMCLGLAVGFRLKIQSEDGLVMLKISSGICRCIHASQLGFLKANSNAKQPLISIFFWGGGQLEQKNPWPTDIWPLRCCQEFPEVCRAAGGKIVKLSTFYGEIWGF